MARNYVHNGGFHTSRFTSNTNIQCQWRMYALYVVKSVVGSRGFLLTVITIFPREDNVERKMQVNKAIEWS